MNALEEYLDRAAPGWRANYATAREAATDLGLIDEVDFECAQMELDFRDKPAWDRVDGSEWEDES